MNHEKETSDLIGQRKIRLEHTNKLRELGIDPYPSIARKTHTNKEVIDKFEELKDSEVTIIGRLDALRSHGQLIFGEIRDQSGAIQLYIRADEINPTNIENQNLGFDDLNLLDVGDFVLAKGIVTQTQRGEKSVLVRELKIAAKSIRPMPTNIDDKDERYRRRYLDMNVHVDVRKMFERRAKFWEAHREFLNERGFFEVNIPVLEHVPGGGDAVPFTTHMNAINEDFFLRISHELPLKRLTGAGFDKVYDIGPRFRNEGLSDEHLPEHVAMEFYWAYANWEDGMNLIQDMFNFVIKKVYGDKTTFKIKGFDVTFGGEWDRLDFNEIMKERFGIKDIYSVELDELIPLLDENNIEYDKKSINVPRAVDSLWKQVRKTIAGPAFLVNHPKYLSPLQKPSKENPNIVERCQPIIAGSELGNGWSELNDPIEQYERFLEQQKMRDAGDDEAQWLDIDYVEMLEYGMPPTFGWGHSERVFWFLEDVTAREGVPFPAMKRYTSELTKKIYPEVDFDSMENFRPKVDQPLVDNVADAVSASNDAIHDEGTADLRSLPHVEKSQDFSNRIAIVVNRDLENWQIANAVAHISGYMGHKLDEKFSTGENFVTKDGKNHPRNTQYPIVVLAAKPGQMSNFMEKVREARTLRQAQGDTFLYHGFIKEMIDTSNDAEISDILSNKDDSEVEYLGIGVFGDNEELKKLTNKFSLWG